MEEQDKVFFLTYFVENKPLHGFVV